MRVSMPAVTFSPCHPPLAAGSIMIRPDPELFGLTDVTSKAALPFDGCGEGGAPFTTPTDCARTGTISVTHAEAASRHFFQRLSVSRTSFVMMCSILFLSSDPVTPATHASGDSA